MRNETVVELFEQIKALSPPDRLRLAAGLLEGGRADMAYTITRQAADEIGAALMLSRADASQSKGAGQ